jgi:hypothetical protein
VRCAVCFRQAKGFGYSDPRAVLHGSPHTDQQIRVRWVFCSMRCQNAFSRLMDKTEGHMIDPSDMELAAMRACLAPLGEYVGAIGMDRPLSAYSCEEILQLIDVVVTAYQDHMLIEHERMAEKERIFFEERLARQNPGTSKGAPF